ncbi:MAG: hypothetical protein FWB91_03665 [Defluviitaleaceae bacterium]|nr:hypothetical protein [Defluviitaleaceae bacterium]
MDINCTHSCFYQHEGKCTLQELPAYTNTTRTAHDIDCPYFSDGQGR